MKLKLLLIVNLLFVQVAALRANSTDSYQSAMTGLENALLKNDYKTLNAVLSEEAYLKIPINNKIMVQSKNQLLKFMKLQDGDVLNCTSRIDYLSTSDAIVIAILEMKFKEFTAYNYVTIEKKEIGEWKVTSIYKLYNKFNNQENSITRQN